MKAIRNRLTYANVVSTLALFLVLAGGAAWAMKVPRKSVGPRQLKANAVTTSKIKANAVTTRKIRRNAVRTGKIRDGAIESAKIADGSVGLNDLNQSALPYSRIVHEARGAAAVPLEAGTPAVYPLGNPFYTQAAGEDDLFSGAVDVAFEPSCAPPRALEARVVLDDPEPGKSFPPNPGYVVGLGIAVDESVGGRLAERIDIGPFGGGSFQPATPVVHRLDLVLRLSCEGGVGDAMATFGAVDVIGAR